MPFSIFAQSHCVSLKREHSSSSCQFMDRSDFVIAIYWWCVWSFIMLTVLWVLPKLPSCDDIFSFTRRTREPEQGTPFLRRQRPTPSCADLPSHFPSFAERGKLPGQHLRENPQRIDLIRFPSQPTTLGLLKFFFAPSTFVIAVIFFCICFQLISLELSMDATLYSSKNTSGN